jgi:hypothetical protein
MGPELILATTVASGAMSAFGKIQEGQAASDAAKYQAQVARNNAIIAQQDAEYAAQAGETQAQAQDFKNRATLGAIAASQASGLSFDSPSLYDVRESSANVLRLDTANIAQNAALKARGYATKATGYEAEARLANKKASDASTAGYLGAAGSLLSSGTSFADKWDKFYPSTKAV